MLLTVPISVASLLEQFFWALATYYNKVLAHAGF